MKQYNNHFGFTLLELLIVAAVILILAVIVFAAIDPVNRIKDARDVRRMSDVDTILNAIHQSIVDNNGNPPTNLPSPGQERQIGWGGAFLCNTPLTNGGCNTPSSTACANLINPADEQNLIAYLKNMPIDPLGPPTYYPFRTGYSVAVNPNGIITIKACGVENTTQVWASR